MKMLFSEIYSVYYNTVAAIISEALDRKISEKRISEIIRERAFSESVLSILPALEKGEWALFDKNLRTPVKHRPGMPLTDLQKRWLKALSLDPRIALFDVPLAGLDNVTPLFEPDDFIFFDRCADGDLFSDDAYKERFRTIRKAMREKRRLYIAYRNRLNRLKRGGFIPYRLEYSFKDDKFRLETAGVRYATYINLNRMESCELRGTYDADSLCPPKRKEASLRFTLKDERNALERVLLHFSDCRKETRRMENDAYDVKLVYDAQDETEILIRVLSFGPVLRVTAPERFISLIRERIFRQWNLFKKI
ncbi:MAG: WYL domain-containing protein [Fusobacteriaceae bacterium]|jgi:hypothetical protein|nr:WYL domain-containing protein [Fusobacteriaceae bacterium]